MQSKSAILFMFFALSANVIRVRCEDNEDDTSVVDAAGLGAADGTFPNFENGNSIQCKDTEEYSRCDANPTCQRTCRNINQPGIPCPRRSCIEGCICKRNFVRSELYGGCIPQDQCGRVKH